METLQAVRAVSEELHTLLTTMANQLAGESGFVQRVSKLTGAAFVQALVFGWLNNPQATLQQLAQMAATVGVPISPQGLDQRLTPDAATFLHRMVEQAVTQVVAGEPVAIPLLERFQGVYLLDSTTIVLPDSLAEVWQGSGGGQGIHTAAAVKAQVQFDLVTGRLVGPFLQSGRSHDRSAPQQTQFPVGALRISDLGYFSTPAFAELHQQGVYWLSRLHMFAHLFDLQGHPLPLAALPAWLTEHARDARDPSAPCDQVEVALWLGGSGSSAPADASPGSGIPIRLVAVRVPPALAAARRDQLMAEAKRKGQPVSAPRLALADWTIFLTNAPHHLLALEEVLVLARARWQIELLFKLWKQHGLLDESRSGKPWRRLCELYAKMLGLLIQHWLFILSCWRYPARSMTQATQVIRQYSTALALALPFPDRIVDLLLHLRRCLAVGCRITKRKQAHATFQLLLAVAPVT